MRTPPAPSVSTSRSIINAPNPRSRCADRAPILEFIGLADWFAVVPAYGVRRCPYRQNGRELKTRGRAVAAVRRTASVRPGARRRGPGVCPHFVGVDAVRHEAVHDDGGEQEHYEREDALPAVETGPARDRLERE